MQQVSSQMIAQGYASQITLVTKEMIAQERADAGATIAGQMLKDGNTEFITIYKAATKKEGADEVAETEKDNRSITQKLKEGLSSVTDNAEGMLRTFPTSIAASCCKFCLLQVLFVARRQHWQMDCNA